MFRTTLDFYVQAYVKAANREKKEKIRPYLEMAARDRRPISNKEGYKPFPEKVIKEQRENVTKVLNIMCDTLSQKEVIEGIPSIKELDFRICQELTNAGWTVTESEEGKVVVYVYLP